MSDKHSHIEDIIKESELNDDDIVDYMSDDIDECTLLNHNAHIKARHTSHPASGGVKSASRKKISVSKQELFARYWQNESKFRTTMNNDESSDAKLEVFQNSNIGTTISQFLDTQSIRNVKCSSFFFPYIDYWRIAG